MTAQPKPLRIKRLTLTDFRAFPGPAPAHFDLDSGNLLVYGENGAGKSSLFYALRDFFSLKPSRDLRQYKNVFSGEPDTTCRVEVTFNDGATHAAWYLQPRSVAAGTNIIARRPIERHPAKGSPSDQRVMQAALRRACLDYRALLDTNYKHDDVINLFDIAVNHLVHDFPVPVAGGLRKTVGELWQGVLNAKPNKHGPRLIARVNAACADFNAGFNQALASLHPFIGTLLGDLIGADVTIAPFGFAGVTYNQAHYKRDRDFDGKTLKLDVSFRTLALAQPQHFLNEGRLSALALAIYLGGRLACTPSAPGQALKLLVLDDVLIGLDRSNRLPVLDVLHTHFPDWQVVLLTHDKTWFDLARERLPKNDWGCCEIYEGDPAATAPMPIVRPVMNKPARALLQKASDLLTLGYVEAAANYARQAFELGLRVACELKKIKLIYRQDPTDHKAQVYLDALKSWQVTGSLKQADWDAAIHRLELLKNVVMNPYSHPSSPNIPKQEVTDAITAVTTFLDLVAKK